MHEPKYTTQSSIKRQSNSILQTTFNGRMNDRHRIEKISSSLNEYGKINPKVIPFRQPFLRASFQRNSQQKFSLKTASKKPTAFREFVPPIATRFVPLEQQNKSRSQKAIFEHVPNQNCLRNNLRQSTQFMADNFPDRSKEIEVEREEPQPA